MCGTEVARGTTKQYQVKNNATEAYLCSTILYWQNSSNHSIAANWTRAR